MPSQTSDFSMGDDSFDFDSVLHPSLELLRSSEFSHRLKGLEECTSSKSVLQGIPSEELEKTLLEPGLSCVLEGSKTAFQFIEKLERKTVNGVEEKIESVSVLLGKSGNILSYVIESCSGRNIRSFGSLVSTFPRIIKSSMDHCRRSSQIYESTQVLSALENALNRLFHEIRENLLLYARILESTLKFDEGSTKYISTILDDCLEYHHNLRDLDYKTLGITWKIFARLSKTYASDLLDESYDFSKSLDVLSSYATESLSKLKGGIGGEGDKKGLRESQMVAFILKIIRQQCELFPKELKSDYKELIKLLGMVLMMPFRCLDDHWPPATKEKMQHEIPSIVSLIIHDLALHSNFPGEILTIPPHSVEEREERFLILLFLLERLNNNDDQPNPWMMDTNNNIFELTFNLFPSFSPAMNSRSFLHGVQFDGKPLSIVFTYEAVICRVQAFIAGLGPKDFVLAERTIFKHLFSTDFWTQVLAGDSLCFIARFGSPELCYSHFKLLVRATLEMGSSLHLEDTLRRLFSFLSDEDLRSFSREYPLQRHLPLWSTLVNTKKKFPEVSSFCESKLVEGLNNKESTTTKDLLGCLRILSKTRDSADTLIMLWDRISTSRGSSTETFEVVFTHLFNWTVSLLPEIKKKKTLLFKSIQNSLKTFPCSRRPCAHFLTRISGEHIMDESLMDILESLLSYGGGEEMPLLHQRVCQVVKTLVSRRLINGSKFANYEMKALHNFDEYSFLSKPIVYAEHPPSKQKKRKWDSTNEREEELVSKVIRILETSMGDIASQLQASNASIRTRKEVEKVMDSLSEISINFSKVI